MIKTHLVQGNSIHIPLKDKSVHMVVTSPPYWGLRLYSGKQDFVWGSDDECVHLWGDEQRPYHSGQVEQTKWKNVSGAGVAGNVAVGQFCRRCGAWRGALGLEPTPELFVEHLVMVFREVWRVLRDDGTLWLNLGSSYWGGKGQSGHGNPEHQAQRVASGESFSQVAAHVGGQKKMRPSDGRHSVFKPKDLVPIPWMVAMALQADGWYLRSDIIWAKGVSFCDDYTGSVMPESVQDRPTKAHEYLFLLSKNSRYFYDIEAVKEEAVGKAPGNKTHKHEIAYEMGDEKLRTKANLTKIQAVATRNLRSVWTISPQGYKGAHFAVFPPALIEPCIKAGTSEHGVCPTCFAPWIRVLTIGWKPTCTCSGLTIISDQPARPSKQKRQTELEYNAKLALWKVQLDKWWQQWESLKPLYEAEPKIPATVLDSFVGSGTTCQVSRSLNRNSIGLDLSYSYLSKQARSRLELDKLDAWESGRDGHENSELGDLPLFADIEEGQ